MARFNKEAFGKFWKNTEVIREYHRTLYTFGDAKLPYVFAAEHPGFKDRVAVRKGAIVIQKPNIILPGHYRGPEFGEGFELSNALPPEVMYVFRAMGVPYSTITNRPAAEEAIEYGSLQDVLDRFERKLEAREDSETGLIKGELQGVEVSLMRYSFGLVAKSTPENVKEYFEHLRRQREEPIRADEKLTDEDIEKLFG